MRARWEIWLHVESGELIIQGCINEAQARRLHDTISPAKGSGLTEVELVRDGRQISTKC